MRIPKNYFENLSTSKYREYLKLLPNIEREDTRIVTTLILTFAAMSFFGIFAINPTLSTIVTLKKQLSDNQLVYEKLKEKNNNLSLLRQQYNSMETDLPVIYAALPEQANAPTLLGQIIALSQKTKVKTTSISVSNAQLTGAADSKDGNSYAFSLKAQGSYDDLMTFARTLSQMDRIITVESLTINKDAQQNTLVLGLDGLGYFKN